MKEETVYRLAMDAVEQEAQRLLSRHVLPKTFNDLVKGNGPDVWFEYIRELEQEYETHILRLKVQAKRYKDIHSFLNNGIKQP